MLSVLFLVCNGSVLAAPPTPPVDEDKKVVTIVVTAQKQEQLLQEVPVAVSVLSGNDIERLGSRNIMDTAVYVPSLNFRTDHSQRAFVSFRGIGGFGGSVPGVSIFVDDVFQPTGVFFSAPLLDIERIEFLRGPQGTLYGRNTLSGAINVISRPPRNQFEGSVEVSAGNEDTYTARGQANVPLIDDRLYLRLAVAHEETDGFITNTVTNKSGGFRNVDTYRLSMRYLPTDTLKLDLGSYYSQQRNAANAYSIVPLGSLEPVRRTVTLSPQSVTDFHLYGLSLRGALDLQGERRIVSVTSFDRQFTDEGVFDVDYTPAPVNRFEALPSSDTFAQELRFEAPLGERGRWMLGGFYTESDSISRQRIIVNDTTLAQNSEGRVELKNYAFFANASFKPTQKIELGAGVRYDSTDRDSTTLERTLPSSATNPLFVPGTESLWQPKVSASYFWTPEVMTYMTVARGYRIGGFNGASVPAAQRSFEPETSWNYEVGAKTMLADGRTSLNVAAFHIDNTDAQVLQIVTGVSGAPTNATLNGGKLRSRGFEVELAMRPSAALQINAATSFNDVIVRANPDPTLVGTRQAQVDRWRLSLNGRYEWKLAGDRALTLGADYAGFGSTRFNATATQGFKHLIGATLGVRMAGGLHAELYGRNLLDEDYLTIYSQVALLVPNSALALGGDPRSYGLRLRYDF